MLLTTGGLLWQNSQFALNTLLIYKCHSPACHQLLTMEEGIDGDSSLSLPHHLLKDLIKEESWYS